MGESQTIRIPHFTVHRVDQKVALAAVRALFAEPPPRRRGQAAPK
jgi:hypothetical protein